MSAVHAACSVASHVQGMCMCEEIVQRLHGLNSWLCHLPMDAPVADNEIPWATAVIYNHALPADRSWQYKMSCARRSCEHHNSEAAAATAMLLLLSQDASILICIGLACRHAYGALYDHGNGTIHEYGNCHYRRPQDDLASQYLLS